MLLFVCSTTLRQKKPAARGNIFTVKFVVQTLLCLQRHIYTRIPAPHKEYRRVSTQEIAGTLLQQ